MAAGWLYLSRGRGQCPLERVGLRDDSACGRLCWGHTCWSSPSQNIQKSLLIRSEVKEPGNPVPNSAWWDGGRNRVGLVLGWSWKLPLFFFFKIIIIEDKLICHWGETNMSLLIHPRFTSQRSGDETWWRVAVQTLPLSGTKCISCLARRWV